MLEPRVLDLKDVIADMDKMLRRLIGEDIDLITLPDGKLGFVEADPGQIEQVVMNLAVNARDAMPQGGQLTIETTNIDLDSQQASRHLDIAPGSYVMLSVSDNGEGMDKEVMARIFEPFFTTKGKDEGTGLGLATVYGIVKQSGGHIWVESEPGHGTSFKIYLPRLGKLSKRLPAGQRPLNDLGGTETILLVEDDSSVRRLAINVLLENGYQVLGASHGPDALNLYANHKGGIDLLLTDVVMPAGMGGRQLAERIKLLQPEIKVLYMSGYTDDAIVRHGISDREIAFLQKPFTPHVLTRKVREVLDTKEYAH